MDTKDTLRAEIDRLKAELAEAHAELATFEQERTMCKHAWETRMKQEDILQTADAIIRNSPVVLFRRKAGKEDPRLLFVSENIDRFGYSAKDMLAGKVTWREIVPEEDMETMAEDVARHTESGAGNYDMEYRIRTADGNLRWVHDRTEMIHDEDGNWVYNQGIVADITEQKLAELELERSEKKLRRILETAAEGFVYMDLDMNFLAINQAYLDMVGYTREELVGRNSLDLAAPEFRAYLKRNRERLLAKDKRRFEGQLVHKSGKLVPIIVHGSAFYDDDGVQVGNFAFITDISDQKKALALAEEVQRSLLPDKAPAVPGLDIAGRSLASSEVGGDYFDYLQGGGGLNIAVGDISGHGVDAALLMTSARAFMRMRAARPGSPASIVEDMNRHLATDLFGTGRFMTLFFIRFDEETGKASWVRAGHDPAVVYSPETDEFTELGGLGLPLGVDADVYFEESLTEFRKGQVIAIGTDGIWEAMSQSGEMFGKARFRKIIRENAHRPAAEILDIVFSQVEEHSGPRPEDDVTLVIVRYADE